MSHTRLEQPLRTIQLAAGGSYYDAAASNRESDYGSYLSTCPEDFYFSLGTRWVTVSRLRREYRNNPYLAGLVGKYPEAIGHAKLRSRTSSKGFNDAKDTFFHEWAKHVTNVGDSLRTVEEILYTDMLVAGELFIVKLTSGRVQLIPSEYCGSTQAGAVPFGDGGKEVNGIVYDAAGVPAFYRFGILTMGGGMSFTDSTLVAAKHVIHVFRKDRVHMGRGLPWLLPSLRPAHDLYEITRAKTKQIKDVTSIFGTIEKANASATLGGWDAGDGGPDAGPAKPDDPVDAVKKGPIRVELRPGMFIALEPGEKLNTLSSKYEAGDYKELVMLMLHAVSSPTGLPVELWFSGLGDVNYSGFKGLGTQWDARRRDLHAWTQEALLDPLHEWRMELAFISGDLPPPPPRAPKDAVDWRWRRTAVLDEEKARKSNQVALASGEISHGDIFEERGEYVEEVFEARRQSWIKLLISTGELKEGGDHSAVIVPRCYILRNELPEDTAKPAAAPAPADPVREEDDEEDEIDPDDPDAKTERNRKPARAAA